MNVSLNKARCSQNPGHLQKGGKKKTPHVARIASKRMQTRARKRRAGEVGREEVKVSLQGKIRRCTSLVVSLVAVDVGAEGPRRPAS